MKILLSIYIWIVGGVLTILALISSLFFAIMLFPFDKQRKTIHAQCFWMADAVAGLNPFWRVDISGLENIDKTKTYVMVSNHQSMADIIVVYKTHMQFKWVAKAGLYKVPVMGAILFLGKHVMLSRCRFDKIKKFYREATNCLRSGMSLFFFPEGTRSQTGSIGTFQSGAFKIAIKEKKPILPIFIDGTRNILQKGSWVFNPKASVCLSVLPPIDTTGLQYGDIARLKDMVYEKFKGKTA